MNSVFFLSVLQPALPARFSSRCAAVVLCLAVLCGCEPASHDASEAVTPHLLLYGGAGLRPLADALISAFEQQSGIPVMTTYAGSSRLLGQLVSSRRGDLFMPGAASYVDQALALTAAVASTRTTVACFVPVLCVSRGNPLNITGLIDLARPGLRLGLGDPRVCAVGISSWDIISKNQLPPDAISSNLVFTSGTVTELAVALEMNAIDVTIIWDATARQFAAALDTLPIPEHQNCISTVPIIRLNYSEYPDAADAFISFITSEDGTAIIRQQGYAVPQ